MVLVRAEQCGTLHELLPEDFLLGDLPAGEIPTGEIPGEEIPAEEGRKGAKRGHLWGKSRKEALVQRILLENYRSYYRLAFRFVHQEADAMDIVQEGAYRAMLKASSLRDERLAGTWVYRIMINAAKEYLRKYKREYEQLGEEHAATVDGSADLELREALERLPVQERTLIILRYYEDKSLAEIADILKENLSTVKSRLYRTLEKLRRELS